MVHDAEVTANLAPEASEGKTVRPRSCPSPSPPAPSPSPRRGIAGSWTCRRPSGRPLHQRPGLVRRGGRSVLPPSRLSVLLQKHETHIRLPVRAQIVVQRPNSRVDPAGEGVVEGVRMERELVAVALEVALVIEL